MDDITIKKIKETEFKQNCSDALIVNDMKKVIKETDVNHTENLKQIGLIQWKLFDLSFIFLYLQSFSKIQKPSLCNNTKNMLRNCSSIEATRTRTH